MSRRKIVIAFLTIAAIIGLAAPAQASGPWLIYTYVRGPGHNGALDGCVEMAAVSSGAKTVQASCGPGDPYEEYNMTEVSSGKWKIYNPRTGFCLRVKDASTADGAAIIQYACSNTARNNLWHLDRIARVGGLDWYRIRSDNGSSKCMTVKGNSTEWGTQIIQNPCGAAAGNDLFTWAPA